MCIYELDKYLSLMFQPNLYDSFISLYVKKFLMHNDKHQRHQYIYQMTSKISKEMQLSQN